MNSLRFFVFVGAVALCLVTGCSDNSSQSKKKGFNLLNPDKSKSNTERIPRKVDSDYARQITQALQQAGDPDKKDPGGALMHYGMFLGVLAVVVAGIVFWQIWRRKRAEWEVNDPMALVRELYLIHQLSDKEKRLMQEIATKNSLPSPLKLFVEPKFLLDAWETDPSSSSRLTMRMLLSQLFDIALEGRESSAVSSAVNAETTQLSSLGSRSYPATFSSVRPARRPTPESAGQRTPTTQSSSEASAATPPTTVYTVPAPD